MDTFRCCLAIFLIGTLVLVLAIAEIQEGTTEQRRNDDKDGSKHCRPLWLLESAIGGWTPPAQG